MNRINELIKEYCPDGVEIRSLEDCCNLLDKKRKPITKASREAGKYPYYGANGIQDYVANYIFDGMFVLVGEDGSVITKSGTPVVTWAEGKIWVNNHAHIIEEKDGVMLRYLYHYLQTIDVTSLIHGNIPKLTGGDFKALQIPIPPLPIQREIVRILDSFTELTKELTNELTKRNKQYEYYRDYLLSFKENTDVKNVPLGDVAKFVYGYTDKAKETGSARFIRITDISEDGRLNTYDAKYVELTEESKKYLLKKGDLLLARTGATYGKTLYFEADEPAVYASFLIKIILDNSVIKNRYYWHFSKSSLYWEQAERYVSKGGQQQFNTNAVSRVKVPIPSLEVQDRIIYVLDNFDSICSDLKIGLPAEIEARQKQYEYYRDALLTYAATGKIIEQTDRQTDRQTSKHN